MESKGPTHEKNSSLPELGSLFPYKSTIFYFWYMWEAKGTKRKTQEHGALTLSLTMTFMIKLFTSSLNWLIILLIKEKEHQKKKKVEKIKI